MPNGYDFSDDKDVLKEQRDAARNAEQWDRLDEKAMAGELGGLNTRVTACILQLKRMLSENDFTKTRDMLEALLLKDLSAEGWLSAFYNTNIDAFSKAASGGSYPDWYKDLGAEDKKTYDSALLYYRDVGYLMKIRGALYALLRELKLAEGFRLMRIKDNFEAAGFDVNFYSKINTDVQRISDFLNRSWDEMERNTARSQKYLENNLQRRPKGELEKEYRAERLMEFQDMLKSTGLLDSFLERAGGYYSVRSDLLAKLDVIDKYTYRVSQTADLKAAMQKTMDDCSRILAESVADADTNCTMQAARFLCAAFQTLAEEVSDFAEMALETYVNFQEAPGIAPYCFMKKLSAVSAARPKYAFQPDTSDPWDSGTYYKELYTEAANAFGSQARLFVYDHGATFA